MEQTKLIPSNSFSSLIIHGLAQNSSSNVPLTFHRGASIPREIAFSTAKSFSRPEGPPTRLPSKLPPPNDLCLEVALDTEPLGKGRVGSVYPVSVTETPNFSPGLSLPPLVIKVAGRWRSEDIAKEAWFYEEMESLQGVSIARCYGFFQAKLPEDHSILNWVEGDIDPEPSIQVGLPEGHHVASWAEENGIGSEHEKFSEGQDALSSDVGPLSSTTYPVVSVLVLERLGGHIPVGVSVELIKPDVYEIYNDIARLGIGHRDTRWRNVVQAPATPESLVCPYHGHPHQWRIIDFDRAMKSDMLIPYIDYEHQSWWESIFEGLPQGYVVDWTSPDYI